MALSSVAARALKRPMSLVLLSVFFSVMLSGHNGASGAHLAISLPSDIPAALNNLSITQDNVTAYLVDIFFGVGHQVYTLNGTTWNNSNVSADLYDQKANKVARHFFLLPPGIDGGVATWAKLNPRSVITAVPVVKIAQTDAVPLLLLNATATMGPCALGSFGEVTHVQRLQTSGGLPPSTTSNTTGDIFFSPYSAIYAFYHVP